MPLSGRARILNKTNTLKSIPWARLGFESALIVVSILLAFSIDRWWSDRQDSIEEQRLLLQLRTEFEENALQLAEKRARHEEAKDFGLRLLSVTGPDAEVEDFGIENEQDDLYRLFYRTTFDPGTGVLSAILHSGKLDLISSEELRSDLAAWPARYQDLAEDEQWIIAMSQERVSPYLVDSTAIRNFSPSLKGIGKSAFPDDLETMLRDRRFENIVASKTGIITTTLAIYDELEAQFDKTLALIQSQIR